MISFGQEGSNEGDFDGPCGVCVDKDGFVYVCDYFNVRVFKYFDFNSCMLFLLFSTTCNF